MVSKTVTPSSIEIKKLFTRAKVIDSNTGWISLNRLWYEPEVRGKFQPILETFLDASIENIPNLWLLVPEGLNSSFGTIPFISAYAFKKGHYLLFWKEIGDILTVSPFIFPNPNKIDFPKRINLVIIQDVVGNGSLLYKMADDLKKYDVEWKIHTFISIINLDNQASELKNTIEKISDSQELDIQFKPMLLASEFMGKA